MTKPNWQAEQRRAIKRAIEDAAPEKLREVLDGTIGDCQAFCWAALTQYERRSDPFEPRTPREHGQHHADMHTLLVLAHEAVCHAERVSQILKALGERYDLPPGKLMRSRLAEARNLLAEHRDERVLYWRLTGSHTEHVIDVYKRLGVDLPAGTIDAESYDPARAMGLRWGTVGSLLSLPDLFGELQDLEQRLAGLRSSFYEH
jgi:hypothetical protein